MTFGEYVRSERVKQGWGLREFCRTFKMSPRQVTRIEVGELMPPQEPEDILIFVDALGLDRSLAFTLCRDFHIQRIREKLR